jgi:hypothetical protein
MENQPNGDPNFSLGGFCSSSIVPSESGGAVFSGLSEYALEKKKPQYICLCLKNIFSYSVKNVVFWLDMDDEQYYQCKYRVGFSSPQGRMFENVSTIFAKPVYVEFQTANGINDAIELPNMQPNDILAVWLERKVNTENPEVDGRRDPDWLFENKDRTIEKEEWFDIKIKFDEDK